MPRLTTAKKEANRTDGSNRTGNDLTSFRIGTIIKFCWYTNYIF